MVIKSLMVIVNGAGMKAQLLVLHLSDKMALSDLLDFILPYGQ